MTLAQDSLLSYTDKNLKFKHAPRFFSKQLPLNIIKQQEFKLPNFFYAAKLTEQINKR